MSLYSSWGFNENDTTKVWDHSGNARHSTSATGLTIVTSDLGKAGRFDGSTTWVQFGNIADFGGTANININIKFKIAVLTTTHYFLFKENHIKIYINNVTRLITWEIYKGGGWTSQSTAATFLTATWYKLGLSYDGVNMKMYINAVIDATLPTTGNLTASSSNLNIGSYNDGASNFLNGDIETFEIRNVALTADNITALSNFPNGMKIQTTKAHSFAAGDLLIQDYGGQNTQAIVTLNEDSKTFHVVPVSAKPLFNYTFIRVGNIKDTARQYFFEQNIAAASPTITIRDGISTFALLTDASTKKVEINKSGITTPSLTLTTPLSPAYGGTGIANNAASTLTIAGNFATTLTISGITSVTLPDSGTLYGTKANSITSAQLLSSVSDETGTGLLVFGTSPTFTTQITSPKMLGGTGINSTLTYQTTSGAGTTGADHVFLVGNNGGTEAMRILNNGNAGFGISTPLAPIHSKSLDNTSATWGLLCENLAGTTILAVRSDNRVGIGIKNAATNLDVRQTQNGQTGIYLINDSTGAAAQSSFLIGNANVGAAYSYFTHFGTGWTTDGLWIAGRSVFIGADTGGLLMMTSNPSAPFIFATGAGHAAENERMRIISNGNISFGASTSPTAVIHLKAGTITTPPIRLTSGALTTGVNILAGNVEFLTDKAYITITTGTAVKEFTLNDIALTSGRVPFITTNGRLTDDADFTFAVDTLTVTKIAAHEVTGNLTLSDGINIITNATTGTKIGTAITQKIGLWDAAPVVQYSTTGTTIGFSAIGGSAVFHTSTFTGNTGATAYTIGDIVKALKTCGIMAS